MSLRNLTVAVVSAATFLMTPPVAADHIPPAQKFNPFAIYQEDAARKRYADVYKIATLLEEYRSVNGHLPYMDDSPFYELIVLAQPEVVDGIWETASPFGFSLRKYRPEMWAPVLEQGLGRDITLPLDPQRGSTGFYPVYFVLMRRDTETAPAHYAVIASFDQPVAHSHPLDTGRGHMISVSDFKDDVFIVPVTRLQEFSPEMISHILEDGASADKAFGYLNQ